MMQIKEILNDRGQKYGDFEGHARIAQRLKNTMKGTPRWHELTDSQKEALEMVVHKLGRILNGDPTYLDSWADIIGYIQLVVDELEG